jgi:threonine synthase
VSASKATSIAVRHPRNALRLLREVRHSEGRLLSATERDIETAQMTLLGEAGVAAEFTSAATLAALTQLADTESLADLTAVLVITSGRMD